MNREELLKRREALKVRIARDQALIFLSEVITALDSRLAGYELLWEGKDPSTAWIKNLFPVTSYGRVDWQMVPKSTCQHWQTDQERLEIVSHTLGMHVCDAESEIVIAWSASKPAIRLKVGDAHVCLAEILAADFDTWIYMPESNWLIESHHEGEVCSGNVA